MDGRDLVRSVRMVGSVRGMRTFRSAWRRRRADARTVAARGAERARVPGLLAGAEPGPGGGVVRFARSELLVRVAVGGAVFWSWDAASPWPSYALPGAVPDPDERARLEPHANGGWQVVSERLTVVVSRRGAVELRTPGGVVLRREEPPRWWETEDGVAGRWVQRSEVPADARFFGLGGRAGGPRLREGTYGLRNTDPGGAFGPGDDPLPLTMPVQMVVSDAGTHLVFHDNAWAGRVTLREGEEGAGSGHDRPGSCEVRMEGGPVRGWMVAGTPGRVLSTWAALTGAPALPPPWALGPQHAWCGSDGEREVRRIVRGYQERDLPLPVLHLGIGRPDADRAFAPGLERFPDLPRLAEDLREEGVRLVPSVVPPAGASAQDAACRSGLEVGDRGVFVQGRRVAGEVWTGERAFLLSRSGWAGMQRYGGSRPGDVASGWPGVRASLALVLGLGLCGVPYSGPVVGGAEGSPSPELYLRWFQLSAWMPLFRTSSGDGAARREPWEFGPEVLAHAGRAMRERERLHPYFVTLAHLARLTGAPYVRPVWWGASGDRELRDCEDAFLLGDALLVAPVLDEGAVRRAVPLPAGRWYDTATERAYEGPGRVVLDAPPAGIPVLARAGAVIPVRGPDGGLELEAWAPVPGRAGGGSVVRDAEDGRAVAEVERYTSRSLSGRVVVEREGEEGRVPYPLRVRGLSASGQR
ncbi:TIM-barrel domain-containing protein [Streptomyces sp. NPDC051784]|uniref:glycoside hydrolase family 31 protein n=1 Tax=Streptomyces sp. NPDC051784 TaxID=3155805 RepID=UPI00342DE05F